MLAHFFGRYTKELSGTDEKSMGLFYVVDQQHRRSSLRGSL